MRLIDAECPELMETIGRREFRTRADIQDWLDRAPTIDAVPVAHAHWIWVENNYSEDIMCMSRIFECSNCGAEVDDEHGLFRYCPWCGMRMEKEDA